MSRTLRVSVILALMLTLAAGCSDQPQPPPTYRLDGDACQLASENHVQAMAQTPPLPHVNSLTNGLAGGECEMEFDGTGGFIQLTTFVAIHSDDGAAQAMFDEFKKRDTGAATGDATVSEINLGSSAYLRRMHDDKQPWKPEAVSLYKFVVSHGTLVLTYLFSGYARQADTWPRDEKALQDGLRGDVETMMKKLAHR